MALKTIQERSTWAGEPSLNSRRHFCSRTHRNSEGGSKRSQTLITNGVTCWVRPTRRWFYQAFNFDFSLGFRTVAILAWCPRHHTMMRGAAALETGRSTVHLVTASTTRKCWGLTTWNTNETEQPKFHITSQDVYQDTRHNHWYGVRARSRVSLQQTWRMPGD